MTSAPKHFNLFTPSIFRSGLLLVLVPCIVGSISLIVLDQFWISTGTLTKNTQAQNEAIVEVTDAFKQLVSYCYVQLTNTFEKTQVSSITLVNARERLISSVKKLGHESEEGKKQSTELENAVATFCAIADDIDKLSVSLDSTQFSSNVERFYSYRKIMRSGLLTSAAIENAIQNQLHAQDKARKEQDLRNRSLRLTLAISFAATALMLAFIVINFVHDVLKRLDQLGANARALSGNGIGLIAIEGDDELTYLNSVFHSVAKEITTAREHHNLIMQMVAHDIRSPIMATQVYADIVTELLGDTINHTALKCCISIKNSSNRILSFVTELLELEKIESGAFKLDYEKFFLKELVEQCIESVMGLAEQKNIYLIDNCQDTSLTADKSALVHVLLNYLSNAIKYSPPGSKVIISCKQQNDDAITIVVTDQGPGIEEQHHNELFDKFYQAEGKRNDKAGFGLGLAICKKLVESHGGEVGLNSNVGKGSQFWFSIPNKPIATASFERKDQLERQRELQGKTVKIRKRNFFKAGLIQQGLLLLSLPILAQSIWLYGINAQLSKVERLERLERKQSDFIIGANRLWFSIFEANSNVAFYIISRNSKYIDLSQIYFTHIQEAMRVMDEQSKDDPETLKAWSKTRSLLTYEIQRLQSLLSSDSVNTESTDLAGLSTRIGLLLKEEDALATFEKQEVGKLSKMRREQSKLLRVVSILIYGAIAANLLMCICLWLLFENKVLRRLKILVEGAQALPLRKNLDLNLNGFDELASVGAQLQKAAADLKEADEQRQTLMNMVAHDIRSPLTAVEMGITTLERMTPSLRAEERASVSSSLRAARGNVERVLTLVNDLLTLDKLEAGKIDLQLTKCNLTDLVNDAIASIASIAKNKAILIETDCDNIFMRLDRSRIIQVLVNLLSNAIKFSPTGSTITVTTALCENGALIEVCDQGPGMNKETADKIFDKFFKNTEQKEAAFGLGLAIAKLIVDCHGGSIGVETKLGEGSSFWIFFPDS